MSDGKPIETPSGIILTPIPGRPFYYSATWPEGTPPEKMKIKLKEDESLPRK